MVERHCVNYIMFRTYIEPDGPFVLYSDYEQLERDRDFWKEQFQVETRYRIELADKGTLQALTDANSRMEKAEAERDRLKEIVDGTGLATAAIAAERDRLALANAELQADHDKRIRAALKGGNDAT